MCPINWYLKLDLSPLDSVLTEQNIIFIGVKSICKDCYQKQHIKYKTKKLLNTIKLHKTLYMFKNHASLTTFGMRG